MYTIKMRASACFSKAYGLDTEPENPRPVTNSNSPSSSNYSGYLSDNKGCFYKLFIRENSSEESNSASYHHSSFAFVCDVFNVIISVLQKSDYVVPKRMKGVIDGR